MNVNGEEEEEAEEEATEASLCRTFSAAAVTSIPIPSPGMEAMEYVFGGEDMVRLVIFIVVLGEGLREWSKNVLMSMIRQYSLPTQEMSEAEMKLLYTVSAYG